MLKIDRLFRLANEYDAAFGNGNRTAMGESLRREAYDLQALEKLVSKDEKDAREAVVSFAEERSCKEGSCRYCGGPEHPSGEMCGNHPDFIPVKRYVHVKVVPSQFGPRTLFQVFVNDDPQADANTPTWRMVREFFDEEHAKRFANGVLL